MSERVQVWRPAAAVDDYHNPVGGELEPVGAFDAQVAPRYDEQAADGRAAQLVGFDLYFDEPTGIRAGDVVEVRGVRCPVSGGRAESWQFTDGDFAGDFVTVRTVEG